MKRYTFTIRRHRGFFSQAMTAQYYLAAEADAEIARLTEENNDLRRQRTEMYGEKERYRDQCHAHVVNMKATDTWREMEAENNRLKAGLQEVIRLARKCRKRWPYMVNVANDFEEAARVAWGGEPNELKPCPWCGACGSDRVWLVLREHHVYCSGCGAYGPRASTDAVAIAAWNLLPRSLPQGAE